MPINLTPHAGKFSIFVEEEEYKELIGKKNPGWSETESEREFLAKLHYLRQGMEKKKANPKLILEKEEALVVKYWQKFL